MVTVPKGTRWVSDSTRVPRTMPPEVGLRRHWGPASHWRHAPLNNSENKSICSVPGTAGGISHAMSLILKGALRGSLTLLSPFHRWESRGNHITYCDE